jgi:hypothetical protein
MPSYTETSTKADHTMKYGEVYESGAKDINFTENQ